MTFGARFAAAVQARGPLCVGIDPHASLLAEWGLPDDPSGLERFALTCVSAFAGEVALVKPQSAFFERFGAAGIAVLERTVRQAREAGALVVLDVKRGDIGSTMTAYAEAYLDPSAPLAVDAITLSPYLGMGSLAPAFDLVTRHDVGAFVLAVTSNAEGPQFQRARTGDGRTVSQTVVDDLAVRNAGATPLGSLGIVFGATVGDTDVDVSALNGPILALGIGAQGGTADDVRRIFGTRLGGVVPSVSRGVLGHGPDYGALRDAVGAYIDEFAFLRG